MSDFSPHPLPVPRQTVDGHDYVRNARGDLQAIETVKPQDLLIDEVVRKIVGYGLALSLQMARFKEHTFDDIGDLEALLAQEYDASVGGKKGNMTLMTVDGLFKVQVQVADRIDFGPELQVAKSLIDECLNEWAADARAEIRTIVTRAFNTDKEGQINRAEIFMLLRLEIGDARWKEAMRAIRDAMRVVGTKTYVRCYQRDRPDGLWQAIPLDMARL